MRTFSLSIKRTQSGVSLLELLTVISIVGILALTGMPQFNGIMQERDLSSATTTLLQSLQKAKSIARAESTIVVVGIQNNTITLNPSNASPTQTMTMPTQIGASSDTTISFNATGLAVNNNNVPTNTSIIIQSNSNTDLSKTVSISTTGLIALL